MITVSAHPDFAPHDAIAARQLQREIVLVFGEEARPRITAIDGRGVKFALANAPEVEIARDHQAQIFRYLHAWTTVHRREHRLCLEGGENIRLFTRDELDEARKSGLFTFHKLHPTELGRPHPEVEAAWDRLCALGLELHVPLRDRAWKMFEERRDLTYESQLISLDGGGMELVKEDFPSVVRPKHLFVKLAKMLGTEIRDSDRAQTLRAVIEHVNDELAKERSPYHLLVMRDRLPGRLRILPAPIDRVHALLALLPLTGDLRIPARRPSTMADFSFRKRPEPAADAPSLIFDGECIERPEKYVELVEQMLALSGGTLSASSIACVEEQARRRLTIESNGQRFEATLDGDGDWIDLPPLLLCLNDLAKASGVKRRFREFRELDWGREIGVAFRA